MTFTLYTANTSQNQNNCIYPNCCTVTGVEDLCKAAMLDHVCASYRGDRRGVTNFLSADVLMMDCDNSHTEDPEAWVRPRDMAELLPDAAFAIVPSRNNQVDKLNPDGTILSSARPRWHIYFPIDPFKAADAYTALKRRIHSAFPFFDGKALDAARFAFSTPEICPDGIFWHDGARTIDHVDLKPVFSEDDKNFPQISGRKLPQGTRNDGMHRFACLVLKRFGETGEARRLFEEHNERCCEPPLEQPELDSCWKSAQKYFHTVIEKDPTYLSPEEYCNSVANPLEPPTLSDHGMAVVLAREYAKELIYTEQTDYLFYDGTRWKEDAESGKRKIFDLRKRQLKDAEAKLASLREELIEKTGKPALPYMSPAELRKHLPVQHLDLGNRYLEARKYHEFLVDYGNYKNYTGGLKSAHAFLKHEINEMDTHEELLNTPGGTCDLTKGLMGLRPHDREDRITQITACAPGTKGSEIWDRFLQQIFCGDAELIEYVQQIAGLIAFGNVRMEAMVIAYGGGRNGKSTFWNTIGRVLGEYTGSIPSEMLTMGYTHNTLPTFAEMKGKRMILCGETHEGAVLSESTVKQITSTDPVHAEAKYHRPFSYIPTHTVVLYTNHLPKVTALDEGTWRRLLVIPFNAVIQPQEDILNYTAYLLENAGPAVMSWIIEGARKVIAIDGKPQAPQVVQEACAAYRGESNWVAQFLEDTCEVKKGFQESAGTLYEAYQRWCQRSGERVKARNRFNTAILGAGFERRHTEKGNVVYGLRVNTGTGESDFLG